MQRVSAPVGLLFSRSGSYAAIGEAMRAGALLAVAEVNADPEAGVTLDPVEADPGGDPGSYVDAARTLLGDGLVHVVGCYTSSSRKEVLPVFEKHDALLWYPSHYEGFETTENVVYTGAAPNQHVIPLARFLLGRGRRRAFFIGSNYIWAWENNRILREALAGAGGAVLGERYVPVGETDLGALVGQILDLAPDFVFATLIGESAYAFLRLLRARAAERGIDQPAEIPVASCSLAEPELALVGPAAADGHLSSSVYFSTVETPANRRFRRAWAAARPDLGHPSADAEASYVSVRLLARAIREAGGTGLEAVRAAAARVGFDAPQGPVRIEPENRHAWLWPRIGRSNAGGTFELLWESPQAVRPDPYLVWETAMRGAARSDLRVVS